MKYAVLKIDRYSNDGYSLVPYRKIDLVKIMNWRNSQMDILRQKNALREADQELYYKNTIEPSFSENFPVIILFSFLKNGSCVGYGGLTNIEWESKRAEVSFLLDTKRGNNKTVYRKEFKVFLKLLKEVAFKDLKFHRLFTETYDLRQFHIDALEESGFEIEGRMRDHVIVQGKYVDSLIHGLIDSRNN